MISIGRFFGAVFGLQAAEVHTREGFGAGGDQAHGVFDAIDGLVPGGRRRTAPRASKTLGAVPFS